MQNKRGRDRNKFQARKAVKKQDKKQKEKKIERDYQTVFSPMPLPYQGIFTDEDSLEQPSALRYIPTTAAPTANLPIENPQMRQNAELERDFH